MTKKHITRCPHCFEKVSNQELIQDTIKVVPQGCICNIDDWYDPDDIPNICNIFIPYNESESGICKHCQHCKECHKGD